MNEIQVLVSILVCQCLIIWAVSRFAYEEGKTDGIRVGIKAMSQVLPERERTDSILTGCRPEWDGFDTTPSYKEPNNLQTDNDI